MLLFGDSLENKEDGLTDIINFLEQKFGVSQLSEIVLFIYFIPFLLLYSSRTTITGVHNGL